MKNTKMKFEIIKDKNKLNFDSSNYFFLISNFNFRFNQKELLFILHQLCLGIKSYLYFKFNTYFTITI